MTRVRRRHRGVAHIATLALLLSAPFTAQAAPPENFFAALDGAAIVAVGQAEHVERPAGARVVIVRLRASDVLKGELPTPAPPLSVVQELLFPSDVPSVTEGTTGLCLLKSMPNYSAYRAVLTAGPYYQFANREKPIIDAAAVPAARRWLALRQLPSNEQATKRVEQLLDYAGDPRLGRDAVDALASTADLRPLLDRIGYDRVGATLRDARVPLAQRHGLLTVLADQHASAALPMLQSVQDPALAPFLHQTIVALGGTLTMAQLQADLKTDAEDQRLAGVDALATVAARATDQTVRHDAIATLAKLAAHDASASVRIGTVDQLGKIGSDALPAIEQLLAQPDTGVVYAAGLALGAIGSPAATHTLAQQFTRGSYDAQVSAVFGLRAIATPEAMQVLASVKANPPDPRLPRVIDFATGKPAGHN